MSVGQASSALSALSAVEVSVAVVLAVLARMRFFVRLPVNGSRGSPVVWV